MSFYETLLEDLADFGYLARPQGSFGENEPLPETFITYMLITSDETAYSSNQNSLREYRVQIALYAQNQSTIEGAEDLLKQLKSKDYYFITGRQLPFLKDTQHYGYAADFRKYIKET